MIIILENVLKVVAQYYIAHPYYAWFFESLVCSHEHLHVPNVRDFPEAKLNRGINVCFLSNKQGDLYILLHKFGVKIILFKLN